MTKYSYLKPNTIILMALLCQIVFACTQKSAVKTNIIDNADSVKASVVDTTLFLPFSILDKNKGNVSSTDIAYNDQQPLYITYFNPDCEDCGKHAMLVNENIQKFKNASFWWVSVVPTKWNYVDEFKTKHRLKDLPNYSFYTMTDFTDPKDFLKTPYGYLNNTPTIMVFKNKKRIAKFEITASIDTLLSFLN